MSVSVKTPRLGAPAGPASPGALSRARSRARPDDLIELSASTYIDQLQRFKVLDSEMPNLFRDASDMIAVRSDAGFYKFGTP